MSFQREIVNNFFKVGALKYSGLIVSFVGSALVSRELAPEEYGVQAIGAIFFGIVILFLDAGISLAVIRESGIPLFQRSLRFFSRLTGGVLGFLFFAAAYPITWWYGMPELFGVFTLYALCIMLNSIPLVEEAVLMRREAFGLIARVGLLATIVQVVLTYGLALAGFSYYALIIPILITPVIRYLFYAPRVDFGSPPRSWRELPLRASFNRIKSLVVNLTVFKILAYAAANVDNLYLSKLHSTTQLGLYNRAYNFNQLPRTIVTGVISTIQLPMFERIREQGQDVKHEFNQYVDVLGAAAFPAVVIFHLFSYEISEMIWGKDWRLVGMYLYPLSILLPVSLMLSACGNLFIVFRGEKYLVYNTIISSTALILGASIGVIFSIKGMIIGTILGYVLGSIPITTYLGFYRLFKYSWREIVKVWWFNYVSVLSLLYCYAFDNLPATYIVLLVYSLGSIYTIVKYIRTQYLA